MKTLILIVILTLAASAQELVSSDNATWKRIAIGYPTNTKKFNLWVETPIQGNVRFPIVRARHDTGPIATLTLDCKAGEFRYDQPDAEWIKAPKGSVGAALLKFACK